MPAALFRRLLVLASFATSALVFACFVVYERPGLGIGHFYYLAIAIAAMAAGPVIGAAAGALATTLYVAGVLINTHVPSHEILTAGTITRGVTFVTIGALIGWFASRNRSMVDELRVLAERDVLTGLPNTRAFEAAITRRLGSGRPFAILLADMDALKDFNREEGFAALRTASPMRSVPTTTWRVWAATSSQSSPPCRTLTVRHASQRGSNASSSTTGRRRRSVGPPSRRRATTPSRSTAQQASACTRAR
jgi:hypothetical protein